MVKLNPLVFLIGEVNGATIYFDPEIHKALKVKAAETSRSISDLINDAVRHELAEDEEDLNAFRKRAAEETVHFEKVLKGLKASAKYRIEIKISAVERA